MWRICLERCSASSITSTVDKHGPGLDDWWDRRGREKQRNRSFRRSYAQLS